MIKYISTPTTCNHSDNSAFLKSEGKHRQNLSDWNIPIWTMFIEHAPQMWKSLKKNYVPLQQLVLTRSCTRMLTPCCGYARARENPWCELEKVRLVLHCPVPESWLRSPGVRTSHWETPSCVCLRIMWGCLVVRGVGKPYLSPCVPVDAHDYTLLVQEVNVVSFELFRVHSPLTLAETCLKLNCTTNAPRFDSLCHILHRWKRYI